ncbi:hypothetical protein [Mycolicibacterium sp. D5.8-2]|nr:hypothetical protein [Mycolicibacterium sp. D5.8-2]MDW5610027.1 hypothetical protein [Mycolicibacterium sp. D5.8-2]
MIATMKPAFTAGVALLGAGVIACAPVEPAAAVAPVVDATVQLSAIPSPLELYPQVLVRAVQNSAALVEAYLADPLPLTRLTIEKQIVALGEAFDALGEGDGAAAMAAIGRVILQPVRTVFGAFEYVDILMNQPNAPQALFQIALSPILGGVAAFGVAIDEVVDAAAALDLVGLVNAVVNIPARVLDGVLNGGYGSPFGDFDNLPGLVTPLTVEGYLFPGPIALGILIDQDAADYVEDQAGQQELTELTATDAPEPEAVDEPAGPAEDEVAGIFDELETDDPQTADPAAAPTEPADTIDGEEGGESADTIDGEERGESADTIDGEDGGEPADTIDGEDGGEPETDDGQGTGESAGTENSDPATE